MTPFSLSDSLANTLEWFRRAVPTPTSKNLHVQLGCHFEEVVEMLESIEGETYPTDALLRDAEEALRRLSDHLKTTDNTIRIPLTCHRTMLDALCDQNVTGVGVAHMLGYDIQGAMTATNNSNWSKFVDGRPIFNADGKITKGPYYIQSDLTPFVPEPLSGG